MRPLLAMITLTTVVGLSATNLRADDDDWDDDWREDWQDAREGYREWQKDRREAAREAAKAHREAVREWEKGRAEIIRERQKRAREQWRDEQPFFRERGLPYRTVPSPEVYFYDDSRSYGYDPRLRPDRGYAAPGRDGHLFRDDYYEGRTFAPPYGEYHEPPPPPVPPYGHSYETPDRGRYQPGYYAQEYDPQYDSGYWTPSDGYPTRESRVGARIGSRIGEAIGGPQGAAIGAELGAEIGAEVGRR